MSYGRTEPNGDERPGPVRKGTSSEVRENLDSLQTTTVGRARVSPRTGRGGREFGGVRGAGCAVEWPAGVRAPPGRVGAFDGVGLYSPDPDALIAEVRRLAGRHATWPAPQPTRDVTRVACDRPIAQRETPGLAPSGRAGARVRTREAGSSTTPSPLPAPPVRSTLGGRLPPYGARTKSDASRVPVKPVSRTGIVVPSARRPGCRSGCRTGPAGGRASGRRRCRPSP